MPQRCSYVVTCEHGGNDVPGEFADLFDRNDARAWLDSHRGYDPGSLIAAEQFAGELNARLLTSKTTRLLVDLNRSLDNDTLFSIFTRNLPDERKQQILCEYYQPYRNAVTAAIQLIVDAGQTAIHLSIHTFSPRIAGTWRPLDVGLLYDPSAKPEADFCRSWQRRIGTAFGRFRVHMNEPYAGTDDGLTTTLRRQFNPNTYYGIEVEICNRFFKGPAGRAAAVVRALTETVPAT